MVRSNRSTGERELSESLYYISRLDPDAMRALQPTRSHSGIENIVQWLQDLPLREDESRRRKPGERRTPCGKSGDSPVLGNRFYVVSTW